MQQDSHSSCLALPVIEDPYFTPSDTLRPSLYLFYSGNHALLSKT